MYNATLKGMFFEVVNHILTVRSTVVLHNVKKGKKMNE